MLRAVGVFEAFSFVEKKKNTSTSQRNLKKNVREVLTYIFLARHEIETEFRTSMSAVINSILSRDCLITWLVMVTCDDHVRGKNCNHVTNR